MSPVRDMAQGVGSGNGDPGVKKKGDAEQRSNCRYFAMMNALGRTVERPTVQRLGEYLYQHMEESHFGFKPKTGCAEALFTLRREVERFLKNADYDLSLVSLGFRQAFDKVHRGAIEAALKAWGVWGVMLSLLLRTLQAEITVGGLAGSPDAKFFYSACWIKNWVCIIPSSLLLRHVLDDGWRQKGEGASC